MKYLRRYLSLLFALVMSLSLFSVTAHAEEIDTSKVKVNITVQYVNSAYWTTESLGQINALNGVLSDDNAGYIEKTLSIARSTEWTFRSIFANEDGSIMFPAGRALEFSADNFYNGQLFFLPNGSDVWEETTFYDSFTHAYWYLIYSDGTTSSSTFFSKSDIEYNNAKSTYRFKFNFTPEKDVLRLVVSSACRPFGTETQTSVVRGTVAIDYGFFYYPLIVVADQESKEEGFLGGILGKITDLWRTAESGFANIVKGITELPQKLWSLIENGLKSLFVPSEESMTAYKDKWDQLLSSRLGAVYQVVHILTESWDSVMSADEQNTIEFPSATINLAGTPFTFGGYTVQVVPDGFGVVVTAVKAIVGIVCSIAFVNGLRKRYDEIMGVEQ